MAAQIISLATFYEERVWLVILHAQVDLYRALGLLCVCAIILNAINVLFRLLLISALHILKVSKYGQYCSILKLVCSDQG